jgi:hypothetical protein
VKPIYYRVVIRCTLSFVFLISTSSAVFCQPHTGKVLSTDTNQGIGFVDIGIIGKNVGTVSDATGNFTIKLDSIYNRDSVRFSMIGYESKSFLVSHLKKDETTNVYLTPKSYSLPEVTVAYRRPRVITLGTSFSTNNLRSGFESNDLGSELGVKIFANKKTRLININFNVAECTFDSVTYRLNVYQIYNDTIFNNILSQPIYITFTRDKIEKVITFDLSKYWITIEGNGLIALELYRDMGEGKLLFNTQFFTGFTYHRKTSVGKWIASPGEVGMYSIGHVIR